MRTKGIHFLCKGCLNEDVQLESVSCIQNAFQNGDILEVIASQSERSS
jgi:hypothetical protein